MMLTIFGAGLSGLLAARRLYAYKPTIIEQQASLPNNHSALLRFRTSAVGDALGIPFKKVMVYKGVLLEDGQSITNTPTIREFNAYSFKSTGHVGERSIINLHNAHRYIAPPDLISSSSIGAEIQYNSSASFQNQLTGNPIISTIPMPELMKILDYPESFICQTKSIWTTNLELHNVNVYQTLYIPYGKDEPYRVSITGNKMTLEFASDNFNHAASVYKYMKLLFGQVIEFSNLSRKRQEYGKIVPLDNSERQKFILWATDKFNIYSLGRYATWRQILLDDVLKDINIIAKFIEQRSGYNRSKHYVE